MYIKNITEVNIPQYLNTIYSNREETPKEMNDHNSNFNDIDNNQIPDNINYINNIQPIKNKLEQKKEVEKEETKALGIESDVNNNRMNSILSINNNNFPQNHLETILETINEASCSRFDSSKLSDQSNNKNENKNNIFIANNENFKERNEYKQKVKDDGIINGDQKIQYSENTTSGLLTSAVNNTKKTLYLFKSEKTD